MQNRGLLVEIVSPRIFGNRGKIIRMCDENAKEDNFVPVSPMVYPHCRLISVASYFLMLVSLASGIYDNV